MLRARTRALSRSMFRQTKIKDLSWYLPMASALPRPIWTSARPVGSSAT